MNPIPLRHAGRLNLGAWQDHPPSDHAARGPPFRQVLAKGGVISQLVPWLLNVSAWEPRHGRNLTRSELNDELTGYLQGYEQEDEYYWSDRKSEVERQRAPPDDVFFKAQERKQEIKERI
jgi:hypothetical protein